jgi:hypothetical protein
MSDLKNNVLSKVKFVRYQNEEFWYLCTDTGFEFPVPLKDTVGAIWLADDKGSVFMTWIRKHMKMLEYARSMMENAEGKESF